MLPRMRRFFDVRPAKGCRVLLSFLYIAVVVAAFLLARPIRNALFLSSTGLTRSSTSMPRSRSRCRCSCRSTRGSPPGWARGRSPSARWCSSAPTSLLFWYAFRFHADAMSRARNPAAGCCPAFLRLGQLLRRDRAGAGLELRQLAVRHAAGEAAVRPGRRGSVARRDRPAVCWRGSWCGPSAARSTCCWSWRR